MERQVAHRTEVAGFFPTLAPDILILQEIRDQESAQFLVDLIPGLDLHVVTAFRRPDTGFSQQVVIASRYPARAGFAEVFTGIYDDPEVEPYRGFAFVALESPWGGTLLVYGVHLKSNVGEPDTNIAMREESARQILSHIEVMKTLFEEYGPIQVLVGGDFNVLLQQKEMAHEQTIALFTDRGYHWTWQGVPFRYRNTWPARGRFDDACFDHFVTYRLPKATAELIPVPEDALSDHRPVLLRIPIYDDGSDCS